MAKFAITLETDDDKTTELFGEPMNAEGIETAISAAFESYGVVVHGVTELPKKKTNGQHH